MLLILLLRIPLSRVLQVQTTAQLPQQQQRLTKVKEYLSSPQAQGDIRVSCVCLSLTTLATSPVSKSKKVESGQVLIALAKGSIQRRAGEQCTRQLQQLNADPELPKERACLVLVTLGHLLIR